MFTATTLHIALQHDLNYIVKKQLKDEVGMAVPKSTQTIFVGITSIIHP